MRRISDEPTGEMECSQALDTRLPQVTLRDLETLPITLTTLFMAMKMNESERDDSQLDARVLMDAWRAGYRLLVRERQDTFAFVQNYNGIRADLAKQANLPVPQAHIDEAPAERLDFMDAAGHGLLAVTRTNTWPEGGRAANMERLRVLEDALLERLRQIRPGPGIMERNAGTIIATILAAIILLIAEANRLAPQQPKGAPVAPPAPAEPHTEENLDNRAEPLHKNPKQPLRQKRKMIDPDSVFI